MAEEGAESAPRARLTGAQRRLEIIAAAQSVFVASGLGGARTSQIAEAAGIAESMLYKHFESKRDLFEAAVTVPVEEFVQSVVDEADGLLDREGPGGVRFYRSFLETMTNVFLLLGVALFSDPEEGRRFYNASIVPLADRYEETVRRSLSAVPGAKVEAAFLARAVIGMMFIFALDEGYRDGPPLSDTARDALADEVRSFVASALTGSGADDLLDLLTSIEAQSPAELTPAEVPPAPALVTPGAWARFWAARHESAAHTRVQLRDLATENQALRRIVADQAIELHSLREQPEPPESATPETSPG